jgi:protocatechuate 3,4-dioxygenase beta subunit
MRSLLAFLPLVAAHAAVVQGVVLDFESGHALARTTISLTPVQNGSGTAQSMRTESNGTFFLNAQPGIYLLTLGRQGFATLRYGATCGTCPGAAVYLTNERKTEVDLRMKRLGAITGTVLDENQVGIPGIPVGVYSATRPLTRAGHVETDDRGAFRVGELMPGPYIIRTAATKSNDGMTYLATFYPDGTEVRLARQVPVELDRTWSGVDFPLVGGKLYRVQGKLLMPAPGFTDSIELISDTGRQKARVDGQGNYAFDNVAPGDYEMYADGRSPTLGHFAAWLLFQVEHDTDLNVPMPFCPVLAISISDEQHKRIQARQVKVVMRRHDLDQEGPLVMVAAGPNDLAPGDWQIRVEAGDEFYAKEVRVAGKRAETRSRSSAEDWVVGRIPNTSVPPQNIVPMGVMLSSRVASVTGRVTDRPNEVAPYAPVWLETMGLEPPDPLLVREARTGTDGSFEFHGLPPGKYRLLSSYEVDSSDRPEVERARPTECSLSEGGSVLQDLSLYHKPR